MTDEQWEKLLAVIDGEVLEPVPVGFIIDSPWLPGWAGISTLDYYTSEQMWFEANLAAVRRFPDVMFLPGFWAEFGMCTEPSAFGAKCRWETSSLAFAEKLFNDMAQVDSLVKPDPRTDGLPPFVLARLKHYQQQIQRAGHAIRFAISRGPLNIASFLLGTTEFLIAMRTDQQRVAHLLEVITEFVVDWLALQAQSFETIDGMLILDDIVGFCGEQDFMQTAFPYLQRIFGSLDVRVKFFHNDAAGLVCAPKLASMGVNMFNFSHEHSLEQMQQLTGGEVVLVGNIPGRDVLAAGSTADVQAAVEAAVGAADRRRLILSCGGGMPSDVPTENIEAFVEAARRIK